MPPTRHGDDTHEEIPIRAWAHRRGINPVTAYRWHDAGRLPMVRRTASGRMYIPADAQPIDSKEHPPEGTGAEECGGACLPGVHIECLLDKLAEPGNASRLVDGLRAAGYEIRRRDDPEG